VITNLAIKNYALIDDIRVDFNSGLTIITGETGAGKSILLGALALLLGKRADMSSVKDPLKKCVIEAEFAIAGYDFEKLFSENDLDYDPVTIVRREILPSGKSRAFVNDTPVTLVQLQALGAHLIDIHSQHETLVLSSEAFQLEVIDSLAGNGPLLENYTKMYSRYHELSETLSALKEEKETAIKELDYNTFLCNELKEAALEGLDLKELEEAYETLNNTEAIQESLSTATRMFSEEPSGMLETAKEARRALAGIKEFSTEFSEYWERLNSCIIELEDLLEGINESTSAIEVNPQKLFEINGKLQLIYKLQQKHTAVDVADLLAIQKELESKIDATLDLDSRIEEFVRALAEAKERAILSAEKLHNARILAIPALKDKLEDILNELGLPNAQFRFNLTTSDNFRKHGIDTLDLLFTANKGLAFGTLKKVASGGELSRIMLAVKAVLANYKRLPTIIFDEIDTGVSGEIANKMAAIMGIMSKSMQLFSITHLPQIAAKGDQHIKVYKEDINNVTVTRLKRLENDDRIVEIAKMIGGNTITEAAIANAKELLN